MGNLVGYARMNTSKKLHAGLLKNVLRSPMSFFDTTPVGRIVCRFSNDVARIDNEIIYQFKDSLISVAAVTCNAVIICTGTPHFLFILVPMTVLYFFVQVNNFTLKISNKIAFINTFTLPPVINTHKLSTII